MVKSNGLEADLTWEVPFEPRRTGAETLDGCAIFVKKSMFRILTSHQIEYFRSEDDPVLNRHNEALALVVALKTAPAVPFIIANTHLLFNPGVRPQLYCPEAASHPSN